MIAVAIGIVGSLCIGFCIGLAVGDRLGRADQRLKDRQPAQYQRPTLTVHRRP